jgi:hypothetical protein
VKSGGWLQRKTPMRRSKISATAGARNLRTAPPTISAADKAYMARVRELECCAVGMPGHAECRGEPVVHHAGRHGMSQKCPHTETIRLCDAAHRELHDHNGWVKHLSGKEIRAWEDGQVLATQRRLGLVTDGTTL